MKYTFNGDVALVSGAGSGIGAATARLLADNGVRVVVSDLHPASVERVVAEIRAAGGTALPHVGDVSRPQDAESAVALAVSHFGALHLAFKMPASAARSSLPASWIRLIGSA